MNFLKNPGFILRLAIALGYMAVGIMLFLNYKRVDFIAHDFALLLGGLMVMYGLFRVYRAYRYVKDEESED